MGIPSGVPSKTGGVIRYTPAAHRLNALTTRAPIACAAISTGMEGPPAVERENRSGSNGSVQSVTTRPRLEYALTELGASLPGPIEAFGRWSFRHAEEVLAAQDRAERTSGPPAASRRGDRDRTNPDHSLMPDGFAVEQRGEDFPLIALRVWAAPTGSAGLGSAPPCASRSRATALVVAHGLEELQSPHGRSVAGRNTLPV